MNTKTLQQFKPGAFLLNFSRKQIVEADAVNFPNVSLRRKEGYRVDLTHSNVPNRFGQISSPIAQSELNIIDMINKSKGELAHTLLDVEGSL